MQPRTPTRRWYQENVRIAPNLLLHDNKLHRAALHLAQLPVLVTPLLGDLSLGLLVLHGATSLHLTVQQHVSVTVFEQIALGPQCAERVLELVRKNNLEGCIRNTNAIVSTRINMIGKDKTYACLPRIRRRRIWLSSSSFISSWVSAFVEAGCSAFASARRRSFSAS
jgi:hypothetical protein